MSKTEAYRFTLAADLASAVGEKRNDYQTRQVSGGTRLYLQYVNGTASVPRKGSSATEFLSGVMTSSPGLEGQLKGLDGRPDEFYDALSALRDQRSNGRARSEASAPSGLDRALVEQHEVWLGLVGKIASSGDWALVRSDAVMIMDGRFTINTLDGSMISVKMKGVANLRDAYPGKSHAEAYRLWVEGAEDDKNNPPARSIPVAVSFEFDAPGRPGANSEIAAKRYLNASKFYWKYLRLAARQFGGRGTISLDGTRRIPDAGFARKFSIDVFEILSPPQTGDQPADVTPRPGGQGEGSSAQPVNVS